MQQLKKLRNKLVPAHPDADNGDMEIRGRSVYDGLPKKVVISSSEIRVH